MMSILCLSKELRCPTSFIVMWDVLQETNITLIVPQNDLAKSICSGNDKNDSFIHRVFPEHQRTPCK